MTRVHKEFHNSDRVGWLRAAVLGANDGVISVAALVLGVAASGATRESILLTGIAGLVAGAMSMAAGEYVSVKSQADTEDADILRERHELASRPDHELAELTTIYMERGLDRELARRVAEKLTAHNALEAHARDELGITATFRARPLQAAFASAASFTVGAVVPLLTVLVAPARLISTSLTATTLAALLLLGGTAARAGGAPVGRGALRVFIWGALALGLTAGIGRLFGASA